MGQNTRWANKLGESNTKLDGPVPGRLILSAPTTTASITWPIINNIIRSDPNKFIIVTIASSCNNVTSYHTEL